MRCSKCGAENPEGKKFCADCGAPLDNRCPQCGADNRVGQRFCGDCGAALTIPGTSLQSAPVLPAAATPAPTGHKAALSSPGGERRHLTVLFSDLVGSTEIAGHMDAEDWREIAA